MIRRTALFAATALAASLSAGATAQSAGPLSVRDSFRIGTAGVLCTAQSRPLDANLQTMFDRGYAVICRDAAAAVGALYALRTSSGDPLAALAAKRPADLVCAAPSGATIEGLGEAMLVVCTSSKSQVSYHSYSVMRGKTVYVAEGLGGYDSALQLGLRSVIADRPVSGEVQVATTSAGDPAAFARVQAGTLDAESALAEAYLRNNAGSYAESAEFFETLSARVGQSGGRTDEYLVNNALQQSNLGNFPAATALFRQAEQSGAADDLVTGRLLRNYRALNMLNQQMASRALAELARPVPAFSRGTGDGTSLRDGVISPSLADQINRENASLERLGGIDSGLRPEERAQILDGQAAQLRGVALRIQGRNAEARSALQMATAMLAAVRDGRVTSTAFLRSESFAELGRIGEAEGNFTAAESAYAESTRILDIDYPQSAAGLAAKARFAAYLGRRAQIDRALALYGEVIAASEKLPGSASTMRGLLAPYFGLLQQRTDSDPKAMAAMFAASQILLRPGVAQTQAVLARELSGGDDEAARLFRQSVTQSREIARSTGEIASLIAANPDPSGETAALIAQERAKLASLEADQTVLQSRLGAYPRYRVLAPAALQLAELQSALRPGEGYYQLRLIGQDAYAMLVTPDTARAAKLTITTKALEDAVAAVRASVVAIENGVPVTYPFDVVRARALYLALFAPFGDAPAAITHLIWEPDGPLLQLPPNLLVMDQAGVDAYAARTKAGGDEFDFTGVAWFGRDRDISTAVSPRAFVDLRGIDPSKGKRAYLGLGQNAIPVEAQADFVPAVLGEPPAKVDDCAWPMRSWGNPISPEELMVARGIIGEGRSDVITGAGFSDSAIKGRDDLDAYRVIHFATHGLVTAPRPECPARPALLTSFGSDNSDGLLSFREIYDLKLDADIVLLSACDTAGMATIAATREAGITTGGNFALDGLVRAFVGAGARTVVASHWPVPDDFEATKRLISGLFSAPAGSATAGALRMSQRSLMDDALTSHPYYWSAFAVVGDGQRPVVRD